MDRNAKERKTWKANDKNKIHSKDVFKRRFCYLYLKEP